MNHKIINYIASTALIVSILAPGTAVLAQNKADVRADVKASGLRINGGTGKFKVIKGSAIASTTIKTKMEDKMRQASTTKKIEKREDRQGKQNDRIKKLAEKINKQVMPFVRAIAVEENLIARIDSRIAKIEAEGKTATEAKKHSAAAKVHIKEAKDSFAVAKTEVNASIAASSTPKTPIKNLVSIFSNVKMHIIEAHKEVIAAITSLKGMSPETRATTTVKAKASIQ